jgi:hypothetical protein
MNALSKIFCAAIFFAGANVGIFGQAQGPPKVEKIPPMKATKLADLAFMTDYSPDGKALGLSVLNVGEGDAGVFMVRISLKKEGETTKTYREQRVAGAKAGGQVEVIFKNLPPMKGVDIGIFLDSKQQVKETNEKNCAFVYANGSSVGNQDCKGF